MTKPRPGGRDHIHNFLTTQGHRGTPRMNGRFDRWRRWSACDVGKATRCKGWRMSRSPSVASATSHLILEPLRRVALAPSQALYRRHLVSRPCPGEGSAQCRGHLRDNTDMKDDTPSTHPFILNKANMKGWLWRPNDIRGPCGPKASWHLSYRWGKTPRKPHPEILSRSGFEPGPAAWQARMLPPVSQRRTPMFSMWDK